jgi:uncharacterized protein YcnI
MRRVHWPSVWSVAGAVCASLGLVQRADAHVTLEPAFVEADARTRIVFETPNERAPHATTSLLIEAPAGVELAAEDAPRGWRLELDGGRARWTGGRIEGTAVVAFPLAVTARTRAGTVSFFARQGYDDGETVRWSANLTVLPAAASDAPSQRLDRALAAAAVGLIVIAVSFLALRRLRRRPLQER